MAAAVYHDNTHAIDEGANFPSEKITAEMVKWFNEIKKTQGVTHIVFQSFFEKSMTPTLKLYNIEKDGKTEEKFSIIDAEYEIIKKYFKLGQIAQEKKVEVKDLTFEDLNFNFIAKKQDFFKNGKPLHWNCEVFAFDEKLNCISQKRWTSPLL